MIQIPANASIFILHDPISFRTGFDGTIAISRLILKQDPMSGAYFVFRSKAGHTLRILCYDGGGFWLLMRRLSQGTYNKVWPKSGEIFSELHARDLQVLIWGGNPKSIFPDLWKKVS